MSATQIGYSQIFLIVAKRLAGNFLTYFAVLLDSFSGNESLVEEPFVDLKTKLNSQAILSTFCNNREDFARIIHLNELLTSIGFHVTIVNNGKYKPELIDSELLWIMRRNLGRDFGGWKDILNSRKARPSGELLLINDTCTWERDSLKRFVLFGRKSDFEIICATQSSQKTRHMQSYILFFKSESIPYVYKFFNGVCNWHFKRTIIKRGEIELSCFLLNAGFEFDTWVSFPTKAQIKVAKNLHFGISLNTITFFKKQIFEEFGFQKILGRPPRTLNL